MEGKGKERALPVDATDAADDEASERATQLHGRICIRPDLWTFSFIHLDWFALV